MIECAKRYQGTSVRRDDSIIMPFSFSINEGETVKDKNGKEYKVSRSLNAEDWSRGTFGSKIQTEEEIDSLRYLTFHEDNYVKFVPARGKFENDMFIYTNEEFSETSQAWRDVITYKLLRRRQSSSDGQPFSGKPIRRPVPRLQKALKNSKHHSREVSAQPFDNLVEFTCWSQTDRDADRLMCWFEFFMERFRWLFRANGIAEILYWEADGMNDARSTAIHLCNRTIKFYVKTQQITSRVYSEFENFDIYTEIKE